MSRRVMTAVFDREELVLGALRALRAPSGDAGSAPRRPGGPYTIRDVYAPYMVHGLEKAAGLAPSRLGWVCGVAGLLGAAGMLWFETWVSAADWPINVGGKPFASLPAFVPPAFEAGVLVAGLTVVVALLAVSRLWPGRRPRLVHPRVTDDRFVVVIEETDAAFDPEEARRLLDACGAVEIEERVDELGAGR